MYAWSGATADTTRNRLVIWGGGHVDWWGNEVYALNLNANPIALTRLDNPSNPGGGGCNSGAYGDGNPCARHTYDGLNYHPPTDTVVQFGGSKTPDGSFLINSDRIDIWSLNSSNTTWTKKGSNFGPVYTSYIPMSAFDPNSGLIFFHDGQTLWSYNPTTNAFTNVDATGMNIRNGLAYSSFVIDPLHKYGFLMGGSGGGNTGGNLYRYDLSTAAPYNHTDLLASSSGCSAYLGTTSSNTAPGGPGVAWYPVRNVIVMWNGGDSVGIYNPTTNSCTTETYSGGPGAAQVHGTFGRFSYFPALGVFALCNDIAQNCYTLRIDSAGGTGGSGPTISAVAAGSITTSAATIGWTTDVAATSQVEYGATTAYGTSTPLNSTMVTAHSLPVAGLAINTLYHYRVHSKNSSGVESISGDFAFQTSNTSDTTPPTVSITSPAVGAVVSGTVTLSANASDNVGVTSVQFQVDGANVGSALASSPYSMSWDTTSASNAIHILTAQAWDAAGNVGTAVGVSMTVSNSTSSADQNFQQRCAAAGVLNCQSFDTITAATQANTASFTDGFKGQAPASNTNRDTSVFLSGGASQRYTWPQNDNTDNCCQDFIGFFGQGANNVKFGQNSDFYVQFAFRADATWTTRGWESDGSWPKLFNIHNEPAGTCDDTSLVGVNFRTYNVLQVFTTCGGINLTTCSDGVAWATGCNGEIYSQQGWTEPSPFTGYQCGYNSGSWNGPNCFNFVANTWYTLYFHVHVGTWGSNNSLMEGWIAPYGQQMKRWLTSHNLALRNGSNTPGFNSIALTQFMTAHSTGNGGSGINPGTNVWFDELIISSQPIAAPAGQTP
jgi:hypothetical protein